MKHLIIIILALVVFECQAQDSKIKKSAKEKWPSAISVSDYNKEEYRKLISTFKDSTISAYGYRKGKCPSQSFETIQPFLINGYSWTTLNKTAMTISNPDSTGKISVYINKKEIKWTSDSTFVIETK